VKITVNGREQEVPEAITVQELLEHLDLARGRIAVERNLEIVPKREFGTVRLAEGDRLEIVTLVGGG
jgi:thiamine biosynthesis protein ThiS